MYIVQDNPTTIHNNNKFSFFKIPFICIAISICYAIKVSFCCLLLLLLLFFFVGVTNFLLNKPLFFKLFINSPFFLYVVVTYDSVIDGDGDDDDDSGIDDVDVDDVVNDVIDEVVFSSL